MIAIIPDVINAVKLIVTPVIGISLLGIDVLTGLLVLVLPLPAVFTSSSFVKI